MEEVTYGFVKPPAHDYRGKIKRMIGGVGLEIVCEKDPYYFSRELVEQHYEVHRNKPFFGGLLNMLLSGPTDQLVIVGEDAVQKLREIVGDTDPLEAREGTIRRIFGVNKTSNAFHAADSRESARREISLHFRSDELPSYIIDIFNMHSVGVMIG